MIDVPQEYEGLINIIFLIVTAFIAYHGLTYRNKDGESNWVHLLSVVLQRYISFLSYFKTF